LTEENKPKNQQPNQEVISGEKAEEKKQVVGGEETFGALFEESLQHKHFDEGEVVTGTVVSIEKEYVMVDIGDKCEGQVPIEDFKDSAGEVKVSVGDSIEILVERRQEEQGVIYLSKSKAEKKRLWENLDQAYRNQTPVTGKIAERVKGGYMVDVHGVRAFMPGSQADIRPVRDPDSLVGKEDQFQVLKFNRRRLNLVVSRRGVMEKESRQKREHTLAEIEEGMILKGKVKNITDYGAFIDIGGVDGLLHITDMNWRRLNHPSEMIAVNDDVEVKVLKFDKATEKISLGMKQLEPDPWDNVDKKYPIKTVVAGRVVSITDYGAFVELEPGVEGLVHVSEMSWSKKRVSPKELVKPDQQVEAQVLDIDKQNRKITLGMKQVMQNPWELLAEKYPRNSRIHGKIKNITNFGVFVGVEDGVDGLVHISDLSWVKKFRHPKEAFKKGDEVEAVVLDVDPERERFSLGIKQLLADPWSLVAEKYRPGTRIVGKVVSVTDFGAFVELEDGIEGLIHISELSDQQVKDPKDVVQIGQEVRVEVLSVDPKERRIRLSLRAISQAEEKEQVEHYQAASEWDGTSKLGEIIQKKLAEAKGRELFTGEKDKDSQPKKGDDKPGK
jgi:small subunit ribosomal protein S1